MKKLTLHSEIVFLLANIILSFAVALSAEADLGLSVIVSPAFIFSQKFEPICPIFTFGFSEYILQAVVLVIFCIVMKKFKPVYLLSFGCTLFYGAILDLWRLLPFLNQNVLPPSSINMVLRIGMFLMVLLLTSLSIAMFFRTYLMPQVYDLFVMGLKKKYKFNETKFKMIYDASFFLVSLIMTLLLLGKIVGISWGTLLLVFAEGPLIGLFGKLLDKYFDIKPLFPFLAKHFEIL